MKLISPLLKALVCLLAIQIAARAEPLTIFGNSSPSNFAQSTQSIELGLKFKSDVGGSIVGVRFYKATGNTGVHTGALWTISGTLLATATFAGESASGWQSANFAPPVSINANTLYVISYHTDTGHQAGDLNYFTNSGVDSGVLHAPSSPAANGNGVFGFGPANTFPNSVYQDSNYWVDVLFNPSGPPPPPPAVAFPGAQGGGANSRGGRGGAVRLVTNLADSGAGSLRACIETPGPRTCVFRTGGTITLTNTLYITDPFITVAGQTAPGGGIQLAGPNSPGNPSLQIMTNNVVIRYLRARRGSYLGDTCNAAPWSCGASVEMFSNSQTTDPSNIMLDHISAEWSNYDAMIALGSNNVPYEPRSVTVSYSIIGEALAGAGQTTGVNFGGYSQAGPYAPDLMTDLDFHHNVFAGFSHRMPLLTVKSARVVNNIVYAWTYYPMRNKGLRDFVNNLFTLRTGQAVPTHEIQAWTENAGNDTSFAPSFWVAGNIGPDDLNGTNNWTYMTALAINESAGENCPSSPCPLDPIYRRTTPIPTPSGYISINPDPASGLTSALLNTSRTAPYDGAGATRRLDCSGRWVDAIDSVDRRIVNAVANGTCLYGSYDYMSTDPLHSPQSQSDLGGWPTLDAGTPCVDANNNGMPDTWESYWATYFGRGTTLDPNGLDFGDGYTNLEHYIDGISPSP